MSAPGPARQTPDSAASTGAGVSGGAGGRRLPVDPRLLRQARSSRSGIAWLVLLGAGQAGTTVLLAVALTLAVAGPHAPAVALLAAGYLARAALSWAEQVVAQRTAARAADELRQATLAAALRHGPAWVARYGPGRLAAVLSGGLDALRPWFGGYLPALVLGAALPPLVLVAMALVDPPSAVIALLTLPLIPVLGALIGWATAARARQRWAADARLAGHFLDVVRGLPTLRVYGRAERQTGVVAAMTDRHREATLRVLRVAFLSSTALDLVGTLSVGLIAVEAGLRVAAGSLGLGPALLVILLAPEAYRPLREVAARFHASADAGAVITDVDEIRIGPPNGAESDEVSSGPAGKVAGAEDRAAGLTARDVRVRYPGAAVDAVAFDVLGVRGGEIVALRGPSGAGKTTGLRALAGLQPMRRGQVRTTGPRPVYLSQQPALAHARTVADALARPGEPAPGDAAARDALRRVGLAGELGPATPLGERGQGVSAGQRQRIALAAVLRAARREPVLLLLDEPTAHLDADAERLVIGELRAAAARGCAVLAVAHRPALLTAADRIIDVPAPAHPAPAHPTPAHPAPAPAAGRPVPATAQTQDGSTVVGAAPFARAFARVSRWPAAAVLFGAASWLAGVVLTGAAAWLLVRAAGRPPVLTLSAAVVLVRASAVARPLLRYLERLTGHDVAFARLGARRARVYADLVPRVPGPRQARRGELITRVVGDVDAEVDGLLRGWLPAAAAGLALGVAALGVLVLRPAAAPALAAGLLVAAWLAPAVAARQATRREAATARARAELNDAVVETIDAVEELAAAGPGALAVPLERSRLLASEETQEARAAGLAAALGHLGWGVAVTGTAMVAGGLPATWAAVLLLGVVALGEPAGALPDAAVARRRAAAAGARLAALAAQAPAATPGTGTHEPRSGAVRIRGLVAGWDPDRPPALRGLDLDLPAGSRVAVLGASGGGKSTLAAVLARLLDPRAGTVRLGGADLTALADPVVRRWVALVGEDADHVFASTVRENLRLAAPGAPDARLREVLARVGLGLGLDEWLGTGGGTISGGQRKRLATARALLAEPALLILDEPTEGLDGPGAEALMADLLDASAGRTVLVLTHRTEGLDLVDGVRRLSGGVLTEPVGSR